MALLTKGERYCKVTHTENGRTTTRRIHTMMVQAADYARRLRPEVDNAEAGDGHNRKCIRWRPPRRSGRSC